MSSDHQHCKDNEVECVYGSDIQEIKADTKEIKKLLLGNGKIGIVAKANILWSASVFVVGGLVIALIGILL